MHTDDLIAALVADSVTPPPRPRRRLLLALPLGLLAALAYFLAVLGLRPDLLAAFDARIAFKITVPLLLTAAALVWLFRLGRPDGTPGAAVLALLVPAVLVVSGALLELALVPEDQWLKRLIGHNWAVCLVNVPLLALGPLCALLFVGRAMAPADPLMAGLAAGLVAAGIGAALYALHCPDDSPLFVAVWYSLATLITGGLGLFLGRRLLRW